MKNYPLLKMGAILLLLLAVLVYCLPSQSGPTGAGDADELFMYCAAGLRLPIEEIAEQYEQQYGVRIRLQYGGSNVLLSQCEATGSGDLYLSADISYLELGREKGLVREVLAAATMRPVIAVPEGNPRDITSIDDLIKQGLRLSLANPDQAAIGGLTREQLGKSGQWSALAELVNQRGVMKPTVSDVANDVKLAMVDAGIVWDAVASQYPSLDQVVDPQLSEAATHVSVGVLNSAKNPTAALRFARYLTARDQGLPILKRHGYVPIEGDVWEETPRLTFYAGAVTNRVLEPVVRAFGEREGVDVTTVYNGCGILTAQMKVLSSSQDASFPDAFMACDVHYMNEVDAMFPDSEVVSASPIVIVVQAGNPKDIHGLQDLLKPGVRLALGQPEQCTIGVLSRQLLLAEGIGQEQIEPNVVTQTATSSLLIPAVASGSADAALAYEADARAEKSRVDTIRLSSPRAEANQPFGVSKSSKRKHLVARLLEAISESRSTFEAAGFTWKYND